MSIQDLLSAELLKLRRTKFIWISLFLNLFIPAILFFHYYAGSWKPEPGNTSWGSYIADASQTWFMFVYIIFIAIIVSLIINIENSSNSWKHLLSLPISHIEVIFSKIIFSLILVGLANVIFLLSVFSSGEILTVFAPKLHFYQSSLDLSQFLKIVLLSYLSSFLMVVIQVWLSFRTKNLIIPVSIGVIAALFNIFARNSIFVQYFFPWTQPSSIIRIVGFTGATAPAAHGQSITEVLLFSLLSFIVITLLSVWDLNRRDIL